MTSTPTQSSPQGRLRDLALRFKLPTIASQLERHLTAAGHGAALEVLCEVFEMEAESRQERRITRLRRASNLPPGKTMETLNLSLLTNRLVHQIKDLCRGEFVANGDNVLLFGLPGRGKSHVASATWVRAIAGHPMSPTRGHKLVDAGHSVFHTPTFRLLQDLLRAKRDLELPRKLRKLDNFEVIILDDIGYVQQTAEEVEVLFTLMAERYERRSLIVTSNLVFSQWDQIFKNPMTTAAAVDRMVHHATVLEFNGPSIRDEEARQKKAGAADKAEADKRKP